MAVRSKRFDYAVTLEADGTMRAEGAAPFAPPPGWSPDHLVLGALARCSLGSLRHHARRAGVAVDGGASVRGSATRREEDGRVAIVDAHIAIDVRLDPVPQGEELRGLLERAERDCFVGASLRAAPRYAWTVNGESLDAPAQAA